ncbi:hypothetical protein SAMN04488136_10387 [Vibrio xiamenensis]|uniref:Uncharacterized protein n=1 Tax=Vibrio xiamenensis TaxID=861298 RepID=A0A1G7XDA3_9VIBR|nr:hypothetical protein [Vibrio xiamenensis]SDG82041.1 hypothetical protein SAMN04488136_10387 [Vibrio xiamenensis]
MKLHACTIVLKNNHTFTLDSVEQSLGILEEYNQNNIETVTIDALDGQQLHTYKLSFEESLESLMNL